MNKNSIKLTPSGDSKNRVCDPIQPSADDDVPSIVPGGGGGGETVDLDSNSTESNQEREVAPTTVPWDDEEEPSVFPRNDYNDDQPATVPGDMPPGLGTTSRKSEARRAESDDPWHRWANPPGSTDHDDNDDDDSEDDPAARNRKLDARLDACEFNFDNPPEPPEPILKLGKHIIGTPGNIVVIQGLPKGGKSAIVDATIASTLLQPWLPTDTLGLAADSSDGRAVLHFETEQSNYDFYALVRRAFTRAQRNKSVAWFSSYFLTGEDPPMCLDLFERALERAAEVHGGIRMVIIDGIADFCSDPNDADESNRLVRRLHKLAIRYNCAIVVVLHENPGNTGKTRGHLGSQLDRKAESSVRVVKDSKTGITQMWVERGRHCFMTKDTAWRFQWDEDTKMHRSIRDSDEAHIPSKPDKKTKYEEEVTKAFKGKEALTSNQLLGQLVTTTPFSVETLRKRIPAYLELGLVEKDADGMYRIAIRQ